MIELRTGLPGSGKSLSMVERLSKVVSRFESHPIESRPIFVHGITDLDLPHSPMPLRKYQANRAGDTINVPDWDAMPDGSLVLIDEAQSCFPPRSSASSPPDYVSWLNTHRHKGFDIWLTTQHPKLIDFSVRALIGKHVHFRRLFGGKRAITYEWDSCCDSLNSMTTAVKSYYSYPKKAFQWYKSAEIHTKQSFKLPAFIIVPIIAIAMSFYTIPRAYWLYKNGIHGHHESKPVSSSPVSSVSVPSSSISSQPSSSAIAYPSDKHADVIRNGINWSRVAGCMQMADKVACFDDGGARVPMPDYEAVNALKNGWPGRSFVVDAPAPSEPVSSPAAIPDRLHNYVAD